VKNKSYPAWVYHKDGRSKIIKSESEEHPEWLDTPAKFEKQDVEKHVENEIISEGETPDQSHDNEESIDLKSLSKKELAALCEKRGIVFDLRAKKGDLIELLS